MSNCLECKNHLSVDYGYSNYTTEGTTFYCGLKLHPDGEFDQFYGTDKRLDYANQCSSFVEGEGIDMDCDRENYSDLSQEQKELFDSLNI
jgi:hypothetical protein